MTYPSGRTVSVTGVEVREANDGSGDDVLAFCHEYNGGGGLKIGCIVQDTETELTFTVMNPDVDVFAGRMTFTDTGVDDE